MSTSINFTYVNADSVFDVTGLASTSEVSGPILGVFSWNVGVDFGDGYGGWHLGLGVSNPFGTKFTSSSYFTDTEMVWSYTSNDYISQGLDSFLAPTNTLDFTMSRYNPVVGQSSSLSNDLLNTQNLWSDDSWLLWEPDLFDAQQWGPFNYDPLY